MEKSKRDWGRSSLIDYLPFLGVTYRIYWLLLARRGASESESADEWKEASRNETSRLFVSSVFSLGWALVAVNHRIALVAVIAGVFLHRILALLLGIRT
ncbi:MAG: hypothetical protein SV253_00670 [Halobacteria archaeon]|nr:hypothetical protein [Halobacteria archaeon]